MKRFSNFSFYGTWIALLLLISSCTKSDSNSVAMDDEQRLLKHYILTHNITTVPESSGLYYIPTDSGTGIKPTSDDVIIYNYVLRLVDDRIIATNIDSVAKMNKLYNGGIFFRPIEYRLSWDVPGLQEGLQFMREGENATFIIPSKLGYGSAGAATNGIGSYYTLIYDIHLLQVIHDPVAYEKTQIEKYLQDSIAPSLTVDLNDSGVYHISTLAGTGDLINDSSTVTMLYTLKLLDGTIVQTVKDTLNPYSYIVASDQVIPGFRQAILEMQNKEQAIVIIPYKQGYGEPSSSVPPFSTLVYDLKILTKTNSK